MIALWPAISVLSAFGLLFGLLLGYAARRFEVEKDPIVEHIDDILPQSQCGQCGYPGCHHYAEAVVNGEHINKCAPGGEPVTLKLAELLNKELQPLCNEIAVRLARKVAYINEAHCIGCTKCTRACPVDAIIGTTRTMHTVITDFCTGCNLCISPCPTDCIEMRSISSTPSNWKWDMTSIPVQAIYMERDIESI